MNKRRFLSLGAVMIAAVAIAAYAVSESPPEPPVPENRWIPISDTTGIILKEPLRENVFFGTNSGDWFQESPVVGTSSGYRLTHDGVFVVHNGAQWHIVNVRSMGSGIFFAE